MRESSDQKKIKALIKLKLYHLLEKKTPDAYSQYNALQEDWRASALRWNLLFS